MAANGDGDSTPRKEKGQATPAARTAHRPQVSAFGPSRRFFQNLHQFQREEALTVKRPES